MTEVHEQLDLGQMDALCVSLREAGIVLLTTDLDGALLPTRASDIDWFASLFCHSPLFARALSQAAEIWREQPQPPLVELFPGCWIAAQPRMARRRRTGYVVVVLVTHDFLASEQLAAMCQAASMDYQLTVRKLTDIPPLGSGQLERFAQVVRTAIDKQQAMALSDQAIDSVGQQLAESYEEINLLYSIIQSMTVVQRPDRFVAIVCEELLATLPYTWIAAHFSDDHDRLKSLAGETIIFGHPEHPQSRIRPTLRRLLEQAASDAPQVLEPMTNEAHREYAVLGNTAVAQPVSSDERVLGLIIAGGKRGVDAVVTSVDMKLLGAMATHLAIFLENAALYEDLNAMFLGTLEALTASIDAKDRYTCGHSQRVGHLTCQLAQAIGLPEHTVERMRIAGLVHDVGKIGVPESVLCNPGRLTEEEFAEIRKHPEIGYRILKDIPQLKDILPGVLYHHERWDGRGYPEGLKQDDIPLIGRLIALADSFDAMSSTRTYRSALGRTEVLEEIVACAGTQFDPALVPVFVKLDFTEYDDLVIDHRAAHSNEASRRGEAA